MKSRDARLVRPYFVVDIIDLCKPPTVNGSKLRPCNLLRLLTANYSC